jgi:hypothetical protein
MYIFRGAFSRLMGRFPAYAMMLVLAAGCPGPDDPDTDPDDSGTTVKVGGKVTYDFVPATYAPSSQSGTLAFSQKSVKPVRNAVVQVRQGSSVLATTNTDEQGNYQLSFKPGSGQLSVVVLAKTSTPSIQGEDNTDGDAIWAMGSTLSAADATVDLHAPHGWTGSGYDASKRVAAPFAVLDSMYTAARAFMAVRTVNFPALKVNWSPDNVPERGDKASGFIGTSHYSPSEKEIYILGKAGVDTDEFDSHVIVHEWGHYFEAGLSRSDSPGGQHGAGDVLDPRLAFGEGYGNAIAAMVLPESVYADTSWGGGTLGAFGFDAETEPSPTDDPSPGAFSEATVLRLLYDLYDSGSGEASYDQVAVGLGPIYDVLVGSQKTTNALTTIGSFITGLKSQPGVNAAAVNTLLAHYELGPITTEWGDGDDGLRAMYSSASLPYSVNVYLTGGELPNTWYQNQYYVFTGTGSSVTVTASSTSDVAIAVYKQGQVLESADKNLTGTETLTLSSTQGSATYVVVLTGFGEASGEYPVSLSIKSP